MALNHRDRVKLSKFLSYILRHNPRGYGLKLDRKGFTPLEEVYSTVHSRFSWVQREDLLSIVEDDPKGRFELKEEKIRATYGHSLGMENPSPQVCPPKRLYHGTSSRNLERIMAEGIKPMRRDLVHLSLTHEDALKVGRRHRGEPVVLVIDARKAWEEGWKFKRWKDTFLIREVPKRYVLSVRHKSLI